MTSPSPTTDPAPVLDASSTPAPRPRRLALVAVLAVAGGLGGVVVGGAWWLARPERGLERAEAALVAGTPLEALSHLPGAEADPTTRDRALILRARVALALGRPAEAVGPLNAVAQEGPQAGAASYWKGRVLLAAGQTAQAVDWFRRAVAARPDDQDTRRWLAAAAYDLGAVALTRSALEGVVAAEPTDQRSWRTLALIRKDAEDFPEAVAAYEATLALRSDQPEVHLEFAEVLVRLGRVDEAEQQLLACRGQVDLGIWTLRLAEVARARGDVDRLRTLVFPATSGELVTTIPADLLILRAELERQDGDLPATLATLDRAVAIDPHESRGFNQRALVLQALGRRDEAQASRVRADQLAEAARELTRLDRLASDRPGDAAVRADLGRVCLVLGKTELGASWFRAALACDPACNTARLALSQIQTKSAR